MPPTLSEVGRSACKRRRQRLELERLFARRQTPADEATDGESKEKENAAPARLVP